MTTRDIVLGRIRSAIEGTPVPTISRGYRQTAQPDNQQLVDRLVDYGAIVRSCSESGVALVVDELLHASDIRILVVPADLDSSWLPPLTERRWGGATLADESALQPSDLDGDDVAVLTSCCVAISDTGTLVLDGGPGQGRRLLTLVPDHHLCVVRSDQIVGTVADAMRLLDARRPLTWISGPSATSDIELRRVEGVHGPRHLSVIMTT